MTTGRPGPLLLLDGMSLVFRAFFAVPDTLVTKDGRVTNALYGFTSMLINLVRDHQPSALAVAFDLPGGTFRDELVADYKGGRDETPSHLLPQFDMVREVVAALHVPLLGVPGYEADDILATLATQARDRQCDVVVVTGDRDCFQLVEDPYIRVLYNRRGVSDYSLYDEAGIVERTGVRPPQYPALAALRGDTSDNLPGVPGVGEKTAAKLINDFGDLDGIMAHLDQLSPKLRENLATHEATVRANLSVIPLVREVPLDVDVAHLDLGGWDRVAIHDTFESYELRTLWPRIAELLDDGSFGRPDGNSPTVRPTRRAATATPAAGANGSAEGQGAAAGSPSVTASPGLLGGGAARPELNRPEVGRVQVTQPATAETAAKALEQLAAAGRRLVLSGCWDGLAGRSPMLGLLVGHAAADGTGEAVWLAGPLLADGAVTDALGRIGSAGGPGLVGHHVKEIFRSLLTRGVDCRGLALDTAIAAYLIDPSAGDYTLTGVCERVFGPAADDASDPERPEADPTPLAKKASPKKTAGQLSLDDVTAEPIDPTGPLADELALVAAMTEPLLAALDADGLRHLHDTVELPLVRVLARMEVVGVRVDTKELRAIFEGLTTEVRQLDQSIQELAGHPFKVNSTPQLRTVLYDELGLSPGKRTKTGFSTDAQTLEKLRDAHPIVAQLLRYREVEKLRSTYGESLLAEVAEDGRIHATFRQTVARTGRLSSERPNLHNIPVRTEEGRRFRRAFVPSEGWSFLVADYDQIELRVIAHLSEDPGLLEAFQAKTDIHRAVAAGVYGIPAEEVTATQRERAKMVSYGLAYGMEAYGLAQRLGTGTEEAAEIMDRYFGAFPLVRSYMDATVAEARGRGFTRTETGRKRPLPELSDRNFRVRAAAERQAMNAGIQGLAADLFKTALVELDRRLEGDGLVSRLVLQVHDEVLVDVAPGEEAQVHDLTSSALKGATTLKVPLEVSIHQGRSWAEAKGG